MLDSLVNPLIVGLVSYSKIPHGEALMGRTASIRVVYLSLDEKDRRPTEITQTGPLHYPGDLQTYAVEYAKYLSKLAGVRMHVFEDDNYITVVG